MPEPDETATQTDDTTDTQTETKVENPEGVLKKNKELVEKLKAEKAEREALAAKLGEFEKAETDRQQKNLEKRGEWEKLRESMEKSHKEALEGETARYNKLFESASRFELAVELSKHEILEGTGERLAKLLLLDEIRPVEEKGKVVWRRIETDEEVKLNEFIPGIKDAYGEYFKADNNPGSDAPGNKGKAKGGAKKRSEMTVAEKSAYIAVHGSDAFLALPI